MRDRRSHAARRRGGTLVWVTVLMVVLVGFTGLAVDAGLLFTTEAGLQATADAAALAGVSQLPDESAARATALQFAAKNLDQAVHGNVLADPDMALGHWDRGTRSFTLDDPVNAMKVTTRRAAANGNPVDLIFARAVGLTQADVSSTAIAMLEPFTGDVIIVLDPTADCALEVRGSVYLDIPNASIQVNSVSEVGFCSSGSVANTSSPYLNVASEEHVASGNAQFDAIMRRGAPPVEDPLADLPEPTWNMTNDLGEVRLNDDDDSVTLTPGYYSGGISATGGTVTLTPGIYTVDGEGLRIRGGASFIADGVMLHVVGSGAIDMRSSGTVRITPPDPAVHTYPGADVYEDVSVFQSRSNWNTSTISGSSDMQMEGRFYFPAGHLELGGTGDGYFGNQFIANTMEIFGNGAINIPWDLEPESGGVPVLVD